MSTTVKNLMNLLELPGLSNLVKDYKNTSIKVNKKYLNRKQFQSIKHNRTKKVFCYGDLDLIDPMNMFKDSIIREFISKGVINLIGNAEFMFSSARFFNSDLSRWNVKRVTDMSYMFMNVNSFNLDLSRWNVINVKFMRGMFIEANFNSDLSGWNVRNVIDMDSMFYDAGSFNSDLSMWNVKRVVCMDEMFCDAISFRSDLSKWNVGKVRDVHDVSNVFEDATSFDLKLSPVFN